jgi:UDP-N-acetylmuramoyl-L-alanyl-D-glutamate--2,6-diaminopimelate ligase
VRNTLQAVAAAVCAGVDVSAALEAVETLEAAPGRLEPIPCPVGKVYVDYAHTPDALENVLALVKGLTSGRVVVVFGCGGDRDRSKRPLMVQAAGQHADEVILTLDNPRTEDPERIFADMKAGSSPDMSVRIEPDRETAIRLGVQELQRGDSLIIAGKGHEVIQEIGAIKRPFDDRKIARKAITELKSTSPKLESV